MDLKEKIEIEKTNPNRIYLYMDEEDGCCKAYEFSAYLITKIISSLELKEEPSMEIKDFLYTIKVMPQLITSRFSGFGIEQSEGCMQVPLYDLIYTAKWRKEFDILKEQQRKEHSRLGDFVLGVSRLRNEL